MNHKLLAAAFGLLAAFPAYAEERIPHDVGVVNHANGVVKEIYIAPASAEGWGGNRLVSRLPGGANASIRFTGPCAAKLRVVLNTGRQQIRNADLCRQSAFDVTDDQLTDGVSTYAVSSSAPAIASRPHASAGLSTVTPEPEVAGAVDSGHWNGRFLTHHYGGL